MRCLAFTYIIFINVSANAVHSSHVRGCVKIIFTYLYCNPINMSKYNYYINQLLFATN